MIYKIIQTTDGKFSGRHIEIEVVKIGIKLELDDFVFEIDKITQNKDILKLFSYNYIIIIKEV